MFWNLSKFSWNVTMTYKENRNENLRKSVFGKKFKGTHCNALSTTKTTKENFGNKCFFIANFNWIFSENSFKNEEKPNKIE